jgi:hypothetical protein
MMFILWFFIMANITVDHFHKWSIADWYLILFEISKVKNHDFSNLYN